MASSAQKIKRDLEKEIITGSLLPGTRLDEISLCERFGISRTPVREALSRLASIGLIDQRPNRGAIVAQLSFTDLLEMFEVMGELEGTCGRLAAQRATDEELKALQDVHHQAQKFASQGKLDDYYDLNVVFHETIYRAAHNEFLAEQTRNVRNRLTPYRRIQLCRRNRMMESFNEHEEIVDAISNGKAKRAEDLLREHVTKQSGSYTDFISSLPSELIKAETGT